MSPILVKKLKKHTLARPVSELDLVFCSSKDKPLEPDSLVKRQFLPVLRRAKLKRIRFHDLRHTDVGLRIEQGKNIKYIQNQSEHGSIQTTFDR
jgi:site-specific recombinase XerD